MGSAQCVEQVLGWGSYMFITESGVTACRWVGDLHIGAARLHFHYEDPSPM